MPNINNNSLSLFDIDYLAQHGIKLSWLAKQMDMTDPHLRYYLHGPSREERNVKIQAANILRKHCMEILKDLENLK